MRPGQGPLDLSFSCIWNCSTNHSRQGMDLTFECACLRSCFRWRPALANVHLFDFYQLVVEARHRRRVNNEQCIPYGAGMRRWASTVFPPDLSPHCTLSHDRRCLIDQRPFIHFSFLFPSAFSTTTPLSCFCLLKGVLCSISWLAALSSEDHTCSTWSGTFTKYRFALAHSSEIAAYQSSNLSKYCTAIASTCEAVAVEHAHLPVFLRNFTRMVGP